MTDHRNPLDRLDTRAVRAALRRRVDGSASVQKVVKRAANDRPQLDRLRAMYDRLRTRYTDLPAGAPDLRTIAQVERSALDARQQETFLRSLVGHGDVGRAAVALVAELVRSGAVGRARTAAQAFQRQDGLTSAGDTAQAVIALHDGDAAGAWRLLARHDPGVVVPLAPTTYFRAGFSVDPVAARRVLQQVRIGEPAIDDEAATWLEIARVAFAGGAEDQSLPCLDRAERALAAVRDPGRRAAIRAEIDWLRPWHGRAAAAAGPVAPAPVGEIAFGVVDYKQPDRARTSVNLGDPVQTLASLGHLVRHEGVRFTGDPQLTAVADEVRARVAPSQLLPGPPARLRLYAVDRDASDYCAVPAGTWMFAFGWLMHPMFRLRFGLPLNPALRPIFVSLHVNDPSVLSADAIDYLRRYAPVGCRDWNTVHLLRAAGVPSFFSGCITSTIDTLFPPTTDARPSGTIYVDTAATGPGDTFVQEFDAVRARSLAENLRDAAERVGDYRDRYERVVASRLHCYLPARSIGANVEFRPKNPANVRFDGLAGITDAAFDEMRTGIRTKLEAMTTAILAGQGEDEVYALWRRLCAPDVARADERIADLAEIAAPAMDVAAAVRSVRERAVVVERREPAGGTDEIHVEFSLDGNLKHQLAVVLDSVVSRTERPVRAHVLCRDHGPADFERFAAFFPTVSFQWLPTDHVDYGRIPGMIGHITVATMDRLLLPDLLPDVARIVHHDLDALCLADLGELYDLDLLGRPLAARVSPHPQFRSGFREFLRAASRLTQDPAAARELVARTHTRHAFDFDIVNAGVMLFDLDRLRADHFVRRYLPYVERFGLNDQAVLNAYAGSDRVELEAGWNWHPRLELLDADGTIDGHGTLDAGGSQPKIAHWAGPLKPWLPGWVNGKDLWRAAEAQLAEREQRAALGPTAASSGPGSSTVTAGAARTHAATVRAT